jgi:hypothetical protein
VTDEEAKALGLRAVVCPGWRLMPGVVDCDGVRVLRVGEHTIDAFDPRANGIGGQVVMRAERLGPPDFRDPATLGCLLELVRQSHGRDASAQLHRFCGDLWEPPCGDEEEAWWVSVSDHMQLFDEADTEAEALVVALEAVPAHVQP